MAGTSVLKLKVDDREYVASLKSAKQGMQDLQQSLQAAGKTFSDVDGKIVEYAKALGDMNTTSKTAKGQINEMTQAFVELSKVYGQMTDQEKQSPLGKGLAESLERLKQRTIDSKNELGNLTRQLEPAKNGAESTGGAINMLKDKLMLNIDAMKLFSVGLQAAKAALDVAKDAFFASEANVDDWGRTIEASHAIYDAFVQSLNNGDFSGFIGHINEIITKAHEAYNALDELNTRMTIINPERTRLQARATELKAIIRKQGSGSSAGIAAKNELQQVEGMLVNAFKTESQLNMNAFKERVDLKLKEAGIKLSKKDYDFLMRTFSSDASYMGLKRGARGSVGREYDLESGGSYRVDNRNLNQRLLDLFTDEWRKENSALLNASYAARGSAASTMLGDARYLRAAVGGGSGGRGGGGVGTEVTYAADSIAAMEKRVQELTKKWREAGAAVRDDYKAQLDEAKKELAIMQNPGKAVNTAGLVGLAGVSISAVGGTMNIPDKLDIKTPLEMMNENLNRLIALRDSAMTSGEYQAYAKAAKSQEGDIAKFKGEGANGNKIVNDIGKVTEQMGQITGGIGDITGGLEQLGVEIPEGINKAVSAIQAVSTILTGIAAIVTLIKGEQTVQTTASWVDALIPFSHGGVVRAAGGYVVPGNFGYDAVPSLLTSGEVVLNKAQQGILASALSDNGGGRGYTPSHVSGEQIWIALNAFTKRTGRGELVTWR